MRLPRIVAAALRVWLDHPLYYAAAVTWRPNAPKLGALENAREDP